MDKVGFLVAWGTAVSTLSAIPVWRPRMEIKRRIQRRDSVPFKLLKTYRTRCLAWFAFNLTVWAPIFIKLLAA